MQRNLKRLVLVVSSILLSVPLSARAEDEDAPPLQHILQYRGRVVVGQDGSGVTAARFATTVAGEAVRYYMLIENGCAGTDPQTSGDPCPAPVRGLTVTLNDDVVFQNDELFRSERVQVALNPVGNQLNSLVLAARGAPRSGARLAIFAVRPAPVAFGGRSILPWAWTSELSRTKLVVHNAGPSVIAFRLVFFNPDGTTAGRSEPLLLPVHATVFPNLATEAQRLGLTWTAGAVHVQWASRNFSRISTVGVETRFDPDESGNMELTTSRELALDDYGPHMLSRAEVVDTFGN